jgi:hypothetical protein
MKKQFLGLFVGFLIISLLALIGCTTRKATLSNKTASSFLDSLTTVSKNNKVILSWDCPIQKNIVIQIRRRLSTTTESIPIADSFSSNFASKNFPGKCFFEDSKIKKSATYYYRLEIPIINNAGEFKAGKWVKVLTVP